MEQEVVRLRCQRIGCNATFTDDDNPEGSCQYHDAGPIFHDGIKEWSCCKKRSHDFTLFLEIPGCKTGKHTTEKPVLSKTTPSPKKPISAPAAAMATNLSSKESCPRCKQGFFCSDHGSQVKQPAPARSSASQGSSGPRTKIVDINQPQTCRNQGCGKTFKEKDNHEIACSYHPGPAVFHDRLRGWKCCDVHVKEFDEFMTIPPCTKGWHNADPVS
ncbi:cysteine and histidine-rich domain-containing protein RAR1 [Ricinus communis]|uniref:Rar1, putative n=1 Tax=Ricinus communis TaxID=3988 RepID=B9R9M1_RICCO|nr:cysteine and histidine-rich domain-containing protein RAR1 [Ricinus communis]EEF51498.1 rar1, putative [Ricinus communis]|eukprot:XP_002510896.1 cysteine and histidine-rich domain-containing protein RAR1 [Ricinus communis]